MLFNSHAFLFGFFPVTVVAYLVLRRLGGHASHYAVLAASLGFYAWWDVRFLPLLISSFSLNYAAAETIFAHVGRGRQRAARRWLVAAIVFNLGTLAIFKYAHFAVTNVNLALGTDFNLGRIILPLGISFFTFEQISFLVDVERGQARPSLFVHYALFVSFFPRLVAGPILRYSEIEPQLASSQAPRPIAEDLAIGLTLFFIGLLKKSFLADGIAPYASTVFAAAHHGEPIDFFIAWGGALAYTCQLYFDFSGYSDMAIGAARCFGIRFPMNFNSPYKATSIIEFWRCWHMTLSRFLRDYLYFALGGNRRGRIRRYVNLMVTMLLGGLWHGANWTFIAWGGLHGLYLMVNHAWLTLAQRSPGLAAFRTSRAGTAFGAVLTFFAVVIAWVFFRAPTFAAAFDLLRGMAGFNGITLPSGLEFALRPLRGVLVGLGISFAEGSGTTLVLTYIWVLGLLMIAFLFPNSQQLLARSHPILQTAGGAFGLGEERTRWRWRLSPSWAIAIGCCAFLGIISITHVSEFLYWQF